MTVLGLTVILYALIGARSSCGELFSPRESMGVGGNMTERLECRVVVRHNRDRRTFTMGMYDPVTGAYAPLGEHPMADREKVIGDLKDAVERAGHRLSLSVQG
jgi:hypothetical protein